MQVEEPRDRPVPGAGPLLLATVFLVATCGLVYELLAGTLSTYLLGNSVTQFSLVIGIFLTAMGLGSFLSRFFTKNLLRVFFVVELLVGMVGGVSSLLLFAAFAVLDTYLPLLVLICLVVGTLVGLEIPLLVRIFRGHSSLKDALGNVLALDYLGALAASLLFPIILLPHLGIVRTCFLFGLLNVSVVLVGLRVFRGRVRGARALGVVSLVSVLILGAGLATAGRTTTLLEDVLYDDDVIYTRSTAYQRLVITRWHNDLRLFIDGNIQFSSQDEFRYHEALVHVPLGLTPTARTVLMLGGGDGLGLREVLKHGSVERVDLVDLDPEMTRLFSTAPPLVALNGGALSHPKVKVHNMDAQKFLEQSGHRYDAIIIDLPDPNTEGLGKLYSRSFYRLVAKHLTPTGIMVTQATSPFYATAAFWCIVNTMAASSLSSAGARLQVLPYRASVPSFGEWGFVMGSAKPLDPGRVRLTVKTRYLTPALIPTLFSFPKDIGPRQTPINRLDDQVLVRLYEKGFRRYAQ